MATATYPKALIWKVLMPLGQFAVRIDRPHIFDARGIAPRFRVEALLAALATLRADETMRSCHADDPTELLERLRVFPDVVIDIVYVHRAPGELVVDLRRLPRV